MGGSILPIIFFALVTLYSFGYTDSDYALLLGIAAILTGVFLGLNRQVLAHQWVKISTNLFIITQSLVIYSDFTGCDIPDYLWILNGIATLIACGMRVLNFQSPRKPATYSVLFFAAFLALFGAKLVLNFFNIYTTEIQTPIIVLGIIASIFLWFEY